MTNALYSRIEAIESFAADVSHELKNPLTSLRSAVETLPVAKTEESRARLLDIIQHDVKRLDRLISDISDASRLDAELQRQEAAPVDLAKLAQHAGCGRQRGEARRRRQSHAALRRWRRRYARLRGAGPRFPAWPGRRQSDRECPLVLAAGTASCASPAGGCATRSISSSMTTGRAFGPTCCRRSSSAFTPTGRIRALARIPVSACRSPSRSSKRMAASIWVENRARAARR